MAKTLLVIALFIVMTACAALTLWVYHSPRFKRREGPEHLDGTNEDSNS